MKKSWFLCAFIACIMFFTAIVLAISLSKTYPISPKIIIGLVVAVLSGTVLLIIARLILPCQYSAGGHSVLPFVKKNEQMVLLIPLSNDQLNRLDFTSDIVEIKYDVIKSIMNNAKEKNTVLNITQKKCGLYGKKTVDVVMEPGTKCMLLTNSQHVFRVQNSGIYILIDKRPSGVKHVTSKMGFRIKYPEMKDGVLTLTCSYDVVCSGLADSLKMLKYKTEDSDGYECSVCELILRDIFESCPSGISTKEKDLWIGQNKGKLAVALLTTFNAGEILNIGFVKDKELCRKILSVKNYIEQHKIVADLEDCNLLFEEIRYKFCNYNTRINNYCYLYNDYYTKCGETFRELMISNIRNGDSILGAMAAIASCKCHNLVHPSETNNYLKGILFAAGKNGLINEACNFVADHSSKAINLNSSEFAGLEISGALNLISKSLGPVCTSEQLVCYARSYIMRKCVSNVTILREVPYSLEFRSIHDPVIVTNKKSEQVVDSCSGVYPVAANADFPAGMLDLMR